MPTSFFAEWPVSGAVAQEIDALLAQIEAAKDQVLAAKAAVENVQAVIDSQEVITARDDALAARSGAEAARDQAQAYASQVQDVSDITDEVVELRDAAVAAQAAAQGYASDAAGKAQEAQTAAQAALGSASEAQDAIGLARLFADNPVDVPFTVSLDENESEPQTFYSSRHWAEKAAGYAQQSAEVPWRTIQEAEIASDTYTLKATDLNKWLRINRATGLTVEVDPAIHQSPGQARWIKVSREGEGTVTFGSAGGVPTAASILGHSSVTWHWPTAESSGKPAGTINFTITAKAGTSRRLVMFLWGIHAAADAARTYTVSLSTGDAVTLAAPNEYMGGSNTPTGMVATANIGSSATDQTITVTVTHGDQFWTMHAVAYTLQGATGFEQANVRDSDSDQFSSSYTDYINPSTNNVLVLFGQAVRGGGKTPATLDRGTLVVTGQTGTTAYKDLGFASGYEILPTPANVRYSASFLGTGGVSASIIGVLPSVTAGGTLKAPGNRLSIGEENGHAYVLLPGDGTVLIEGT